MHSRPAILTLFLFAFATLVSCGGKEDAPADQAKLLFPYTAYPSATAYNGMFYFLRQAPDIEIYASDCVDSIAAGSPVRVFGGPENNLFNIWSPELVRIGDKWYIYFEADDGNTDNHQIYVLENPSADPLSGQWTLHGPVITDSEWNFGIHPTTFTLRGRQYLLWSGWEHRRAETETQCIFIAELENPWTLKSDRILISRPEYEWERQWVSPDGTRSAYPIFVNENPEVIMSADSSVVNVAYSASGIWTPYSTVGLLTADASDNLLDPASWHKNPEPQSPVLGNDSTMVGISNISVLNDPDDSSIWVFFQAHDFNGTQKTAHVYVKHIR